MKEFIVNESKKAMARFKRDLIFIAKMFFILAVNLLCRGLPHFLIWWIVLWPLVIRPAAASILRSLRGEGNPPQAVTAIYQPQPVPVYQKPRNSGLDVSALLRQAENFLREIRLIKK